MGNNDLNISSTSDLQVGKLSGSGVLSYTITGGDEILSIGSIIDDANIIVTNDEIHVGSIHGDLTVSKDAYIGGQLKGNVYAENVYVSGGLYAGQHSSIHGNLTVKETGVIYYASGYHFNTNLYVYGDFINRGEIRAYVRYWTPNAGEYFQRTLIKVYGNIENTGTIDNSHIYINWEPISGYSDYILDMSGEGEIQKNSRSHFLSSTILSGQDIYWRVKGDGVFNDSEWSEYHCINAFNGCVNLWETTPIPTNLQQILKSPEFTEEILDFGEQIGKYQSGTGIILRVDIENPDNKDYKLLIQYEKNGVIDTYTGGTVSSGTTLETTLPYQGTGSYLWSAAVSNADETLISDWVDFDNADTPADFTLYEGFEPYPFGYSFGNSYAFTGYLDGEVKYTALNPTYGTFQREKIGGAKWEIFDLAFDLSGVSEGQKLTAFEALGLNETVTSKLNGGTCYGMVISAAMEKSGKDYLENHYSDLDNKIGTGYIYDAVNEPYKINGRWGDDLNIEGDEDILNSLLAIHLSQFGDFDHYGLAESSIINNPNGIFNEIQSNPSNTYVLTITGVKNNKFAGHIGIPYRAEGNKIYIWDPNVPYKNDSGYNSYDQYLSISGDNKWSSELYLSDGWTSFDSIILTNIETIYKDGSKPLLPGYNQSDILYSLVGKGDLLIYDGEGNKSGFQDGLTINEIEGVNVITPYNSILGEEPTENTGKQIYLPQKRDDLTIHINGKVDEEYTLMIAGGDYYTKVEGVSTRSGQTDIFTSTRIGLEIDFDDTKTGDYNLLTDNFYNSGTGTVYLDGIASTPSAQQYIFDWTKVGANDSDAVTYTVDEDNNGIFDETPLNLPPVYQDLEAPITAINVTGTETPTSSGSSFYDTVDITLTSIDNTDGTGVQDIYYAIGSGTGELTYLPYTETLMINGVGYYTFNYYSVDNFGNIEESKSTSFTLIEQPETYAGEISGYTFFDTNQDQIWDTDEKTTAGWKICIDTNNNGTCEENIEPFMVTNNTGYYEFDGLATGTYTILIVPRQNWTITTPTIANYTINLSNGEVVTDRNFGNYKAKGKGKK